MVNQKLDIQKADREFISRKVYYYRDQWKKKRVKALQNKWNEENTDSDIRWKLGQDKDYFFLYYDKEIKFDLKAKVNTLKSKLTDYTSEDVVFQKKPPTLKEGRMVNIQNRRNQNNVQ